MRITGSIQGGDELLAQLKKLKADVDAALDEAALAGGQVICDAANRRAPGPFIKVWLSLETKLRGVAAQVEIFPDLDHWYYRFFETGVMPWQMSKKTGRTVRSSTSGGGGRPIRGTKKAFRFWGGQGEVVATEVELPGMAARPFLRPAIDEEKDAAIAAVGYVLRSRIEAVANKG